TVCSTLIYSSSALVPTRCSATDSRPTRRRYCAEMTVGWPSARAGQAIRRIAGGSFRRIRRWEPCFFRGDLSRRLLRPSWKRRGPSPVVVARRLHHLVQLILAVRAGARCEFDGCNKYLLEDSLTLTQGNFGEMAHIVAFREAGPRGTDGNRPRDINRVDNLML